jgi:hypothetical protein
MLSYILCNDSTSEPSDDEEKDHVEIALPAYKILGLKCYEEEDE